MNRNNFLAGNTVAFGHPGIPLSWIPSSKGAVGTAYSRASKLWFTLSRGVLNEVYYPTIDRPQIRDLQFLITDGEHFFHEERRDLHSEIHCLDGDSLGYSVQSEDPEGRYSLYKEIIADPTSPCLLIHTRIEADAAWLKRLRVYAFLAPRLECGGAGNSAWRGQVAGKNILIAGKQRTYLALAVDRGFARTSCGFTGISDGWQDLNDNFKLDWAFDQAENGNVAVIGEIDLSQGNAFTLGMAFGDGPHAAITSLVQSLSIPFASHRSRFVEQWHSICCEIPDLGAVSLDGGALYRMSHNLLLAHEDKTFSGAIIASASIPWGEARRDEDLGGYHLVWTRDMVHSATALLACRDIATPRRTLPAGAMGGGKRLFAVDPGRHHCRPCLRRRFCAVARGAGRGAVSGRVRGLHRIPSRSVDGDHRGHARSRHSPPLHPHPPHHRRRPFPG